MSLPRRMMCSVCKQAKDNFAPSELHGDRTTRRCLDCDPATAAEPTNLAHKLPPAGGAGNSAAQRQSPSRRRDGSPTRLVGAVWEGTLSPPRGTAAGGAGNSAGDFLRYYPKA